MNFYPQYMVKCVDEITPEHLQKWGIRGLILDIDNTLTTHDNPVPGQGVALWLKQMRDNGVQMIVLSNNTAQRVEPFAKILGLPFVANGKKPLKSGYLRCSKALGLPRDQLCMVGDQLFTDIWGGNCFGCKTILVEPIQLESMPFFKVKRFLEKQLLKKKKCERGETK